MSELYIPGGCFMRNYEADMIFDCLKRWLKN